MGIFDKVNKNINNSTNKDFEKEHKFKQKKHQTAQEREQINPHTFNEKAYTSPVYPLNQQAKDKLSTSAIRKAIFSKTGFFESPGNLDMDNLKYVLKDTDKERLHTIFNSNRIDKDKKLGLDLPDFIYGGGENDLIPIDGIDFKKTYNSEAQALMISYYSNPQKIAQIRKMLYMTAATYLYGTHIDIDELKQKVNQSNIDKLSNIEAKIEFERIA